MFKQLAGDSESALAQIWKVYGDELHRRIILIVGREEWAREVLSDVLNALWNNSGMNILEAPAVRPVSVKAERTIILNH